MTTLRDSNVQIVQFENRLATLTSVLDDSTTDLDAAVTNLSVAVGGTCSGSSRTTATVPVNRSSAW